MMVPSAASSSSFSRSDGPTITPVCVSCYTSGPAPNVRSARGVHSGGARRRWIRYRVTGWPDGGVQRLRPGSVVDVLLEGGVDLLDHRRVALLDADTVDLIG